jgi:large subunit ribosomal protein L6
MIKLADGVTAKMEGTFLILKGQLGEARVGVPMGTDVEMKDGDIAVRTSAAGQSSKATVGTLWALIKNAVQGVSRGFSKILEIEGVGYRASLEGKDLVLFLGYAEPVRLKLPEGIAVKVEKNVIAISGIDKDLVGRVAAGIRALKKPEPYKGKGIHYKGEVIKRKVGKKAATTAGV